MAAGGRSPTVAAGAWAALRVGASQSVIVAGPALIGCSEISPVRSTHAGPTSDRLPSEALRETAHQEPAVGGCGRRQGGVQHRHRLPSRIRSAAAVPEADRPHSPAARPAGRHLRRRCHPPAAAGAGPARGDHLGGTDAPPSRPAAQRAPHAGTPGAPLARVHRAPCTVPTRR